VELGYVVNGHRRLFQETSTMDHLERLTDHSLSSETVERCPAESLLLVFLGDHDYDAYAAD
jgi:hypothetical protein